jgi:hypothetical protein
MKFSLEMTKVRGVEVNAAVSPAVLNVLVSLAAGGLAWPWLMDVARALGWL